MATNQLPNGMIIQTFGLPGKHWEITVHDAKSATFLDVQFDYSNHKIQIVLP